MQDFGAWTDYLKGWGGAEALGSGWQKEAVEDVIHIRFDGSWPRHARLVVAQRDHALNGDP